MAEPKRRYLVPRLQLQPILEQHAWFIDNLTNFIMKIFRATLWLTLTVNGPLINCVQTWIPKTWIPKV